ncbi:MULTISPECIES: flavin reductase family protein [Streptomyces]|uniref:Flavin reductase family protein n=1 Tax=Streptomyces sindenensis TaxID=67363 RepID=A0ABW6EJL5_9ACTN|nr:MULTISPECIES: flavin reductase family protein [Streptomyces]WGP10271.1 flavin reductase family protein [Streptomyces sp. SH5]GGP65911.1 flavin reductase [Streptomyces sindenensis]
MSAGERSFRDCLGQFASGVTVVTIRHGDLGTVHGATVSSFTSVSLRPPLVMVSLDRRSRLSALLAGGPFGVNVLAADQGDLALRFAGRSDAPHEDVEWQDTGPAPRLAGSVAHFACGPWASYDGGDHLLYVGEVLSFDAPGGEPLVFHSGAFHALRSSAGLGSARR